MCSLFLVAKALCKMVAITTNRNMCSLYLAANALWKMVAISTNLSMCSLFLEAKPLQNCGAGADDSVTSQQGGMMLERMQCTWVHLFHVHAHMQIVSRLAFPAIPMPSFLSLSRQRYFYLLRCFYIHRSFAVYNK
jgi:hypothetical protein